MKRVLSLTSLFLLFLASLFAGDKAEFVNLGFSPKGDYFLFGQYGFSPEKVQSYADVYLVNVAKNRFVSGSVFSGEYKGRLEPGQSPDGALFSLLEFVIPVRKKYNIDFLRKGRPLYIRISDNEGPLDVLEFRDFETGASYTLKLIQSVDKGKGEKALSESSFYIDMVYTPRNGAAVPFVIGHPDFKRKGIVSYRIERVMTDPENKALIIIIAKIDMDLNVRYMVETLRVR